MICSGEIIKNLQRVSINVIEPIIAYQCYFISALTIMDKMVYS